MLATALRKENGEPVRQCALTRAHAACARSPSFLPRSGRQGRSRSEEPLAWTRRLAYSDANHCVWRLQKRAFFSAVSVPPRKPDTTLADTVDTLLEKAALGRLSLANKAGLVTAGFTKVSDVFDRGQAVLLLHASDAAPAGREKLDAKAERSSTLIIDRFNSEQLSLALGRSNVIHAALSEGGACESFLRAADRLETYRKSRRRHRGSVQFGYGYAMSETKETDGKTIRGSGRMTLNLEANGGIGPCAPEFQPWQVESCHR